PMSDVPQSESGLASGVVNTAFMMGGALGLAVLASLAAARTDRLLALGADSLAALNGGYHIAFAIGAVFAAAASLLSAALLRAAPQPAANSPAPAPEGETATPSPRAARGRCLCRRPSGSKPLVGWSSASARRG